MAYTVHQAKTNLSKLIEEACDGKEVIIAKGKKPMVRLVPIEPKADRIPGQLAGQLWYSDDAFDPLTDQEMKDLGFE
jgi:prevent-host-death family protein